jgi:hypothetical protein
MITNSGEAGEDWVKPIVFVGEGKKCQVIERKNALFSQSVDFLRRGV